MAKRVQLFRGTASVVAATIIKAGELMANLSGKTVHLGDGTTPGGTELARADLVNVADATAGNAGKMTAAQVATLDALSSGQSTLMAKLTLSAISHEITIPAGTRRIWLDFDSISGTTSGLIVFKLTVAGVLISSGYGGLHSSDNGTYGTTSSTGFAPFNAVAGDVMKGCLEISLRRNDDAADYQWVARSHNIFKKPSASADYRSQNFYAALTGLTTDVLDKITVVASTGLLSGTLYARFEG